MPKRHHRKNIGRPTITHQQQGGKTCPSCKTPVSDTAKFCPKCGHSFNPPVPIEIPNICVYCSTPYEIDARFCLECGEIIPLPPDKEQQKLREEVRDMHKKRFDEWNVESDCNIYEWRTFTYEGESADIFGFDELETEGIIDDRAKRLVLAEVRNYSDRLGMKTIWAGKIYENTYHSLINNAWSWEKSTFKTDNPQLHEALFKKWGEIYFLLEAQKRGIITPLWTLSKKAIQDLQAWDDTIDIKDDEQIPTPKPPFEEKDALLKANEKPLPQPRYLDREVIGKAIRFSEIEAVLVVYVDTKYKGEKISIRGAHGMPGRIKWKVFEKQEAMLRNVDGTIICAAIFPHIPLFTKEYDRRKHPNLKNRAIEVSFMFTYDAPHEYGTRILVETVTLTAGNVEELDWRGKKGEKYDDYQARKYEEKEESEARRSSYTSASN